MLHLDAVSVAIGNVTILHSLSCAIKAGQFIAIVGPNGAGKTTLFNTIAGRRIPHAGRITLDGRDITSLNEQQRAHFISRLFQEPRLNGVLEMSVKENIAMAYMKGKPVRLVAATRELSDAHTASLLAPFNLDDPLIVDAPLGSLSGGQRQAVAFIMATVVPPRLLMLDEPTASLDPIAATALLTLAIRFIKQHQFATLMITHDIELAIRIADVVWVIQEGKITHQVTHNEASTIYTKNLVGSMDYDAIEKAAQ